MDVVCSLAVLSYHFRLSCKNLTKMERKMDTYSNGYQTDHDREKELKAFDSTKAGVKGLVDGGIDSVPKIFIRTPDELSEDLTTQNVSLQVPVIDLVGTHLNDSTQERIVEEIRYAAEKWGFFQVINHGIPSDVLDKMLESIRTFHEQDVETKKEYYTRDTMKEVVFDSNYDLYKSKAANWRDTLTINTAFSGHLDPELLPPICRDAILEHISHITRLGKVLLELLSRALGLRPDYLNEIECDKNWSSVYHYYPACPQPELTLGISKHTDTSFLTVVLQDQLGGLQVLHQNQWVDVQPIRGALVINIGDLLQMVTNDRLISVWHRVKANHFGPRISTAFFFTGLSSSPKKYGPIEELISEETPAIYREFTVGEYVTHFFSRPLNEPGIKHFMLKNREANK